MRSAYAAQQKCDVIIDIATLTGACMVALGAYKAGLMSNDDDLVGALQKAAEESGESVWHMPTGDEYAEEMKSKIADLKNAGSRCRAASAGCTPQPVTIGCARVAAAMTGSSTSASDTPPASSSPYVA